MKGTADRSRSFPRFPRASGHASGDALLDAIRSVLKRRGGVRFFTNDARTEDGGAFLAAEWLPQSRKEQQESLFLVLFAALYPKGMI